MSLVGNFDGVMSFVGAAGFVGVTNFCAPFAAGLSATGGGIFEGGGIDLVSSLNGSG